MKKINDLNTRPVGKIDDSMAKNSATFLNSLLANEYALFTKTLNYHWNVTGPRFHSLHNFLEEQYNSLLTRMDDIAERVRVLDETPVSTIKEMKSVMDLDETSGRELSSNEMIQDLFTSHVTIQEGIKTFLKDETFDQDPGTEDFLIATLQEHEVMSWMLKSHLD